MQLVTNPDRFATLFNMKFPDAYRRIAADDVKGMTTCELIGRYGYYHLPQDGKTVMGILQYEQLREKRSAKEAFDDKQEPPKCKMCHRPLSVCSESKRGRPREYCPSCESSRSTERYHTWREKKGRPRVESTSRGA